VTITGAARRSGRPEGGYFGHRSPPGSRVDLRPAGGGPGGPTWPQGHLVRWRASPTGASASSFASSPYKWLAPGRPGGASVRPTGLFRRCKYKPRQRGLHPVQLSNFSRLENSSEICPNQPSSQSFLGERLGKKGQNSTISAGS